ncbi:hypothetical protein A3D72_02565 [Candidatus Uhrbacteria bacterium RIFCSPHIGHO2_02_FULL_57_19]|uniref:Uncharacterized protein n=1 Tax=Candidatus Uhrbacteria bacterium RIFCSPHIGHO2_02_FULL_57_19 TaxID=1802391 RepID=A0A1F7U7A9_9BACT|nr:MAG: hypothetical protein A3D72_02565 [Candidatus Uhrbacteria bacterium RIFCSPHIGHO2_02_FULL_57_19]
MIVMHRNIAKLVALIGLVLPLTALAQIELLEKAGEKAGFATEGEGSDITVIVGGVIKAALTVMGTLFLAQTVYGGYLWMTARGEEEQITKAKHTLRTSVIGLGIMLGAYAITTFVVSRLTEATLE